MGIGSSASGAGSSAVGFYNSATGADGSAVGSGNFAMAAGSSAMGWGNYAAEARSSAFGYSSVASGVSSSAFGYRAQALNIGSTAIGYQAVADRDYAVAVGSSTAQRQIIHLANGTEDYDAVNVSQLRSLADWFGGGAGFNGGVFTAPSFVIQGTSYSTVGAAFSAVDSRLTALGSGGGGAQGPAGASAYQVAVNNGFVGTESQWLASLAGPQGPAGPTGPTGPAGPGGGDGHFVSINSDDSSALNYNNDGATGTDAMALGVGNTASGNQSTAVGILNTASGDWSGAYGAVNAASGTFAHAFGINNEATGVSSMAFGDDNTASGGGSIVMGRYNTASGGNASAMGSNNTASGEQSSAVGFGNTASGDQSSAFGYQSRALGTGSTAIGHGAVADRDYTVSVGSAGNERQVTNVADGTEATDAVNVRQMRETATDTLTEANAYTDRRITEIAMGGWNDDFSALRTEMDVRLAKTDRRIDRIGAMGAAMTHMAVNAANGTSEKGRLAVGVGAQGGEGAVSIGYGKRVGARASFSLGASFSSGESTVGGGFGIDL